MQYESARAHQTWESFRLVAAEALGGGDAEPKKPEVVPVQSFAELAAAFSGAGGRVG